VSGLAALSPSVEEAPGAQVTQWLFAFDAAGIATYRTLALIVAHPDILRWVRSEIRGKAPEQWSDLPLLRGAIRECLRLWPTTPAILRETTKSARVGDTDLPPRCDVLIYTPYFHRDEATVPDAHRFVPERWLGPSPAPRGAIIPFSFGPAQCPAHHLVPMFGAATLAAIFGRANVAVMPANRLGNLDRLPGSFDHTDLRFGLTGVPRTKS
jgi:cytochrome P450